MEKFIAVCGLDCARCGAYIATMTNDNEVRKKTAAEWTVMHSFNFTPEMINCHGCHATDGVQVGHCSQCEFRKCAAARKAHTCGSCSEYPCKSIEDFHAMVPGTAENLRG
jgi:hypothetical protein